ncbi:OmpA family protein [Pedobacter sp. JCM 36344]|uniref:OmpA family protein n=1 Tax=Pedobacter sp. JCM 36344 TaxID=3374280 RepID=UPI0039788ED8
MKLTKSILLPVLFGLLSISLFSCKTKKLAAKPVPAPTVKETQVVTKQPETPPVQKVEEPTPIEKPNFNFKNVQFEFNSDVLKTSSYAILDKVIAEIKKEPTAKFALNGNSSAEGSAERNMSLSVDRANSVKTYLVNGGLAGSNFTINGNGESKPIEDNKTEAGRIINRRVEITRN